MASRNLIDNYTDSLGFGLPINVRRGNPLPLDNSSVILSLEDAMDYAQNDPVAYVGQIISVIQKTIDNKEITDAYQIINEAGDLRKISGSESENEEISEEDIDQMFDDVFNTESGDGNEQHSI